MSSLWTKASMLCLEAQNHWKETSGWICYPVPLPGEPIFLHRSAPEELNPEDALRCPPLVNMPSAAMWRLPDKPVWGWKSWGIMRSSCRYHPQKFPKKPWSRRATGTGPRAAGPGNKFSASPGGTVSWGPAHGTSLHAAVSGSVGKEEKLFPEGFLQSSLPPNAMASLQYPRRNGSSLVFSYVYQRYIYWRKRIILHYIISWGLEIQTLGQFLLYLEYINSSL